MSTPIVQSKSSINLQSKQNILNKDWWMFLKLLAQRILWDNPPPLGKTGCKRKPRFWLRQPTICWFQQWADPIHYPYPSCCPYQHDKPLQNMQQRLSTARGKSYRIHKFFLNDSKNMHFLISFFPPCNNQYGILKFDPQK